MSKSKAKTNEQVLVAYIKDSGWENPIMEAIIRERLLKIADITEESMNNHPDKWEFGIIDPQFYRHWIAYTRERLAFDDKVAKQAINQKQLVKKAVKEDMAKSDPEEAQ